MTLLLAPFKVILYLLNEVTGQLFPLWKGHVTTWKQIHNLQRCKLSIGYPLFDLEVLLRYLHEQQGRRQIIEDKAKTNILGITLAFTVILATVAFAPRITDAGRSYPDPLLWAFMSLQLYGILFLLAGGGLALKTLRVAQNYIWTLQDERDNSTKEDRNSEISWYLKINEEVSRLKGNLLDASYSCIRNGVVALAISAILVLIFLIFNS